MESWPITDPTKWPQWTPTSIIEVQILESLHFLQVKHQRTPKLVLLLLLVDPPRYSQLYRLTVVIAYVYRFIHNLQRQQPSQSGPLTSTELSTARRLLISTQLTQMNLSSYLRKSINLHL